MEKHSQYSGLEDALDGTYKLVDEQAYGVVGFIPDVHVATDAIEEIGYKLAKQANGKTAYLVLQDIDEKKDRLELFKKARILDPQSAILGYTLDKLETKREKELLEYLTAIEMNGGIDQYLQILGQHYGLDEKQLEGAKNQFIQANIEASDSNLEEKIRVIQTENQGELETIAQISQLQMMAYDRAISQYNLGKVGNKVKELNEKLKNEGLGEVKIIAGGGNHDNRYDTQVLKHYLGEEYVHDMNDLAGAIELGEGDEKVTFQVAGNMYGIVHPSDSMIYPNEVLAELYPHMYKEQSVAQDFDPNQEVSFDDAMKSREYTRVTNGGRDNQTLDFLLTHDEFGVKMGFEDRESPYPNLDNPGLVHLLQNNLKTDENGNVNVYSGHLHSAATKTDDDWNMNKHRAYAYLIDSNGAEMIEDLPNKHPKLEYEQDVLNEIGSYELMMLAQQNGIDLEGLIQNSASDDYYDEDEKAA